MLNLDIRRLFGRRPEPSDEMRDAICELHEATRRANEVADKAGQVTHRGVPLHEIIRREVDREMRGMHR